MLSVMDQHEFQRSAAWPASAMERLRADKVEEVLRKAAAVSSEQELRDLLDDVLDSAVRIIPGAESGLVELVEGQELVCRAAVGDATPHLGSRLALADSLSGKCTLTGRHVLCGDTEVEEDANRFACRVAGARSMLIVPLPYRGGHSGNLKFYASQRNAFDNEDLLLVQLLAGPVTIALSSMAYAQEAEERSAAMKRFVATFEQAAVGMAHVSPAGRLILVNDRFCEIAGHGREALMAGGFQQITHPEDLDANLACMADLLAGNAASYEMEKRYITAAGATVWVNLTVSLVRRSDGEPDFFVAVVEDISERRQAETAAARDELTGLYNRRGLGDLMEPLLSHCSAAGEPITVAFLDLDGFKQVNDKFGHDEGDRCLVKVSRALEQTLRSGDKLARVGGDEFLALLPGAAEPVAERLVGRLQQAAKEAGQDEAWKIEASAGAVVIPPSSQISPKSAITAADLLMYRAKQSPDRKRVIERYVPEER